MKIEVLVLLEDIVVHDLDRNFLQISLLITKHLTERRLLKDALFSYFPLAF